MNRAAILIAATASFLGLPGGEGLAQERASAESFELATTDGLTVFGELYSPNPADAPVLLLFFARCWG